MLLGDLVDALSIVNAKMYDLCNTKTLMARSPENYTKEELAALMAKDIALCEQRSKLKNLLNKMTPGAANVTDEVKSYGQSG